MSRHLRLVLAATAVLGLAWAGWSQRAAIAEFDWSVDRWQLALAVVLFAVAPLLQALTFVLGLRRIGATGPAGALVRVWARSFLLRYEPSGAVGFVYRVTARERLGTSTAQVLTLTGCVLVPLGPGGLGLRDGSLILWLGASVGAGVATGLALALRLVSFAGELVAIALAELLALVL